MEQVGREVNDLGTGIAHGIAPAGGINSWASIRKFSRSNGAPGNCRIRFLKNGECACYVIYSNCIVDLTFI